MGLNAGDALRLLSQHPSIGGAIGMGLLGGSGALAYNAISKPTLDEYGNTIESNDINPFVAALGGAAIGAAGGGVYGKYNQPVARPVPKDASIPVYRSMKGMSDIGLYATPQEDLYAARMREKGVQSLRNNSPSIRDTRKPPYPDFRNMSDDEFKEFYANRDDYYSQSSNDRKAINSRMADIAAKEYDYAQAVQGVEDLRPASTPIRQIVQANPMKPQNPMSPPGADIVVVPQNPVQESADELMALQNLAGSQGNPPNLVNEYFDPSPNVRTFVQDVYSPEEKYLYSQIGQKQFQSPDRLPKLIQQPVRPGQEEFITTRRQLAGNAPGWNVVGGNSEGMAQKKMM